MSEQEADGAARRIVDALAGVEKAKEETHPSFKDAAKILAHHELHAATHQGAAIVSRAYLALRSGSQARRDAIEEAVAICLQHAEWSKGVEGLYDKGCFHGLTLAAARIRALGQAEEKQP